MVPSISNMKTFHLPIIMLLMLMIPILVHNANATVPQLSFGSLGSGPGQLHLPRGIAVDDSGNIYVADNRNHRVEVFGPSGKYVSEFDKGGIPEGIAIDRSGDIVVLDRANMTVEKYGRDGRLVSSFGSAGSDPGQLGNAERVAVDAGGNIYVTDANDVQKFDSNGSHVSYFFANNSKNCCMSAMGIAADSSNNIYVADMMYHRIIKFNSTGSILSVFNATFSEPRISSTPQDVAVDSDGSIYVADTYNGRIVKLDSQGRPVSAIGISGVPVGLAVKDGMVYTTDIANNRVEIYATSQFVNSSGLAMNSTQPTGVPLNKNSTALEAAINLAKSSAQFQSMVKGYNYSFSSDFEESGPLSKGGIGLTARGFAFELYSGPVKPGSAVKVVEVLEDPTLSRILNVTSYPAVYMGPAMSAGPHTHPVSGRPSPLAQLRSGISLIDVTCKPGFYLAVRMDHEPACLKPATISKFASRGLLYGAGQDSETTILIPPGSGDGTLNKTYSPDNATVVIGINNTVTWVNQANATNSIVQDMPVVQNLNTFGSDQLLQGDSYRYTFTEPGVYHYHGMAHPWQRGTINVISVPLVGTLTSQQPGTASSSGNHTLPSSFEPCQDPWPQKYPGIPVLYMPQNSTGKICVRYHNLNDFPVHVGVSVFEAGNLTETANDATTWSDAENGTIGPGDSTVAYWVKTGGHKGLYGLTIFCVGMPFAVGYDGETLQEGQFPWLGHGQIYCPMEPYDFHIDSTTGIRVGYIQAK